MESGEPEPEPETETEPEREPEPESMTSVEREPEPGPEPEPESMTSVEPEPEPGPEPEPMESVEPEPEPEPGPEPEPMESVEPETEPDPELEAEPTASVAPEPHEPIAAAGQSWETDLASEPEAEPETGAEPPPDVADRAGHPEVAAEAHPEPGPSLSASDATAARSSVSEVWAPSTGRSDTAANAGDEIELLWLGPQDDAADEPDREGDGSEAAASVEETPTDAADDQLTRIAEDQGWDAAEVEAMRVYLDKSTPDESAPSDAATAADEPAQARPSPDGVLRATPPSAVAWPKEDAHPSWRLPGAEELDEALAALRPTHDVPLPGLDAGAPEPDPAWRERRVVFGAARSEPQPQHAAPSPSPDVTAPVVAPSTPESAEVPEQAAEDAKADREAPPPVPLPSLFGRPRRFEPAPTDARLLRDQVGSPEPDRDEAPEPLTPRESGASTEGEAAHDESEQPDAGGEPEWLRGRRDPAARAYRRLRRIFPN
jgi:hypothetical protein